MIAKGQRYKVQTDIPITAMTSWAAPFTGGYKRVLRAGEEFVVSSNPPAAASAVYADAVAYRRLHREFIPFSDRWQFWVYRGFYLCIKLQDIDSHCRLVTAAA